MRLPIALLASALFAALPTSAFAGEEITIAYEEITIVYEIIKPPASSDEIHLVWHIEEGIRAARVSDFKGDMDFSDVMTNLHYEASADGKMLVVSIKDGADFYPIDPAVFDELDDLTYDHVVGALLGALMRDVSMNGYAVNHAEPFTPDGKFLVVTIKDGADFSPDGRMLVVSIKDGADFYPIDPAVFDDLDDLTYGALVDALYKVVMEDVIVSSYSPSGGAGGADRGFDDVDDLTSSGLVVALEIIMQKVLLTSVSESSSSGDAGRDFDDLAVYDPPQEAICIGSSDCDDLLVACEATDDCEFTCHIAVESDGQACVVGSTD